MTASSLVKQNLERASRFPDGILRLQFPTERCDLRAGAAHYLTQGGFTSEPLPLETLHHRLPSVNQSWRRDRSTPSVNDDRALEDQPVFLEAYHALIRYLARDVLGFDVRFEQRPNLRFHFPGEKPDRYRTSDGQLLAYHSDTLFGDSFSMINCWLPLTPVFGSNALHYASLASSLEILDRFCIDNNYDEASYVQTGRVRFFERLNTDLAFRALVLERTGPLVLDWGQIVLFDPRLIHGTMDNTDDHTRVSVDFRLIPVEDFEALSQGRMSTLEPIATPWARQLYLEKVDFYNERTAFTL